MLHNMSFDERSTDDPTWIRAIAHPLRWQILDALRSSDEPLTATQVSDIVGESPANCSFHLRTLAKYGFIEEAGGGKGRSRPWRARDVGIQIAEDRDHPAPEGARELRDILRSRSFRAIEKWENQDVREAATAWQDAALSAEWELRLTVDELQQLNNDVMALLERYTRRDRSPDDAVRAKVLAWAFPLGAPTAPTTHPATERQLGAHLRTSSSAHPEPEEMENVDDHGDH